MSKPAFKKIIKVALFLLIFATIFNYLNQLLSRKDALIKMADFYSEQHDFDVLFLGSSHPQYAIQPMELWQQYGFTSYNLAVPSERLTSTYYNLYLALQETHPKLVVVDVFTIDRIDKNTGPRENPHRTLDLYPISFAKARAIKNILKDDKNLLSNEFEYLFNFPLYHNRWEELSEEDFSYTKNPLKGAETSTVVASSIDPQIDYTSVLAEADQSKLNISALQSIIALCKDRQISLVLTYLPNISNEKQIGTSKAIEIFAKEHNTPYLNYLKEPINNPTTDFMDSKNNNSHLNYFGAQKLSTHLGAYLVKQFVLPDHRKDSAYASWHTDYEEYSIYIENLSAETTNAL